MRKFRTGDLVQVMCGKSKGLRGRITRVVGQKLVVEGANQATKHMKPRRHHNPQLNQEGGIKQIDMPLHESNVMHIDDQSKPARIGFRFEEFEGKRTKVRYYKTTGNVVNPTEQAN